MDSSLILILILLVSASVADSIHNKIPIRRIKSLKEKLIEENKWESYLKEQKNSTIIVDASEPVKDYSDLSYVADLTIGTPPKTFTVIMDTGSANLWVQGINCTNRYCNAQDKYDPLKSSTYHRDDRSFSINYGEGSCNIVLAEDIVCIADTDSLCVSQTFGMASTVASAFSSDTMDGICGLAFQSLAVDNVLPPIQNMINNNLLDHPWFTFWLTSLDNANGQSGGQMTLGDYDTEHCSTQIDWVPLSNATYYQINLSKVQVEQIVITSTTEQAISDTGTSLIIGPINEINQICQALGGKYNQAQELYYVDCSQRGKLSPVYFTINGIEYSVSSYTYVMQYGSAGKCILGFSGMDFGRNGFSWILGDVWIREYCQVYDMRNKRLGICKNLVTGFSPLNAVLSKTLITIIAFIKLIDRLLL